MSAVLNSHPFFAKGALFGGRFGNPFLEIVEMKIVPHVAFGLLVWAAPGLAEPEKGSPATNEKDRGVLQAYNQELKEQGWHRKEANALTDALAHTFGDAVLLPLPNPNQRVIELFEGYQADYARFEQDFPKATAFYPRSKGPSKKPGIWSHIRMNPTAGRIYDLELNPKTPDEMYANPDGDGIFFSGNGGRNWRAITDNIPSRLHRDCAENIIVDPRDFNHVFSISRLGHLHETKDRGTHWKLVLNAGHKNGNAPQFKWVEAFRDANNALTIIGVVTKGSGQNGGWKPGVYRSADAGSSWEHIPVEGAKLQEMAFHKKDRNLIYLAGRSKLFVSTDAGKTFALRKDFETGDRPMFVSSLYGNHANALYAAVSTGKDTQVHFSADRGATWELRQDSASKTGYEKGIFGRDGSSGWTSFFEVDPFDKDHLMASSVGSCESFDGGVNWTFFSWGKRADAVMPDGSIAPSPHGGHNADNHVLKFHPARRGFRVKGCDAGIMAKKEDRAKNWTNINGDMPAFLWYSIIVNEFGDRYIAGNTQDVNIQTHRYGRWENEIGYEGDSIFINPYLNTTYFPCSPTEEGEGLDFLEPGRWKMHSWNMPKSAANYSHPDQLLVAFGRRETEDSKQLPKFLYLTENRGVSYRRVPNLDQEVFAMNLSRTPEQVLTVFTAKSVMASKNMGGQWQSHAYPTGFKAGGGSRKVGGAVNPDNPQELWAGGQNGKIFASHDGGKNWQDISGKLPKGQVSELVFHEGSGGDLYALINGYGVFHRAAGADKWIFWMDGFNLTDFREIRIDYPNQKLVAASYGRGAWEAPLMNPCERFYKKGFAIKQLNEVAGLKVFGIDSDWVTPDYYTYHWFVNRKAKGASSPVFTVRNCRPGDTVELVLTPRNVSGIKTISQPLKAKKMGTAKKTASKEPLKVEGSHIDLGNIELFGARQDMTFETTLNLSGAGVVAGNRRQFYRDAKGWYLSVNDDGELSLHLSARQNGNFSRTFKKPKEQALVVTSPKGSLSFQEWVQIAFSISSEGEVALYINGEAVGRAEMAPADQTLSLNSVLSTTLFADPIGMGRTSGEIKNVRIWHRLLTGGQLKINRTKLGTTDGLVYYAHFSDSEATENLTGNPVAIREGDTPEAT